MSLGYICNSARSLPRLLLPKARTPTRTLRLAGRILNTMNRPDGANDGGGGKDNGNGTNSASKLREAVEELVHHNVERSPEQQEQFRLMAAFVARLCVAGSGGNGKAKGSALSWPSAQGRGFPGLIDTVFGVLGKMSCNVSPAFYLDKCRHRLSFYKEKLPRGRYLNAFPRGASDIERRLGA